MSSPRKDDNNINNNGEEKIPEEEALEQPVTMSASVVITQLPRDTADILDQYANLPEQKVQVRFKSIGSAKMLKRQVYTISSAQKWSVLVKFLRSKLDCKPSESLFCYINSSFAPGLDETIGNLYKSFAIESQLMVSYCNTVAFG